MENLDNLMDFEKAVRNISPNSKFMKPLIMPVTTTLRVRTVSDPARLSLDNNPFDKALREIELKTMDDDPFEKVLKASLNTDQSEQKDNNLLATPTILIQDVDYAQNNIKMQSNAFASPSKFSISPECIACHCKKKICVSVDSPCLCNIDVSNCNSNDAFQSSGSFVNSSTKSVLNKAIQYSLSEVSFDILNSTNYSQQSSLMNRGFVEEFRARSSSERISILDSERHMFVKPDTKIRSKSDQSSFKMIRENTFAIEKNLTQLLVTASEQVDLNKTVFEEANDIANSISEKDIQSVGLERRENSIEDLMSVEPVWSDVLSDIETTENDQELRMSDVYVSSNATPKAKELLNDIKGLLESKEIRKKALDDILCRVSNFCDTLKSNNENKSGNILWGQKKAFEEKCSLSVHKNMNDHDTKKAASTKLPCDRAMESNINESKAIKNQIPQFLERLQESTLTSDSALINALIMSLRVLLNDKLCNKKENINLLHSSKMRTPNGNEKQTRRSNSAGSQYNKKPQILNVSFDSNKQHSRTPSSLKSTANKESDNKLRVKNKSLIPNATKPKLTLAPFNSIHSSRLSKSSLTDDSKIKLKTSTPNMDIYHHNGAFVFSTPSK